MGEVALSPARVAATLAHPDFQAKIKQALPPGMSPDRFTRAAITAIQNNPDIVDGDKDSLYLSIVQAAQTGLSLDGKEAALVIFNTKRGDRWVKKVQFMPMVGGIIKNLDKVGVHVLAEVVYENDVFDAELGDHPKITHKPAKLGTPRGAILGCYAIFKRGGQVWHEIMDKSQVQAVRAQSRAPDSLMWTKFESEGYRKSVVRRAAKRVPIQDETVEATLNADDDTFGTDINEDLVTPAPPPADPTVVSEQRQQAQPEKAEQRVQSEAPQAEKKPSPSPQRQGNGNRPKALAAALNHEDAKPVVQHESVHQPKAYVEAPHVAETAEAEDDVF